MLKDVAKNINVIQRIEKIENYLQERFDWLRLKRNSKPQGPVAVKSKFKKIS